MSNPLLQFGLLLIVATIIYAERKAWISRIMTILKLKDMKVHFLFMYGCTLHKCNLLLLVLFKQILK